MTLHPFIPYHRTPKQARKKDISIEKISIITPVSRAEYLEEAIRSVLAQTSEGWEHLLLSDGAPLEAEAIMRRYASGRTRVSFSEKRGVIALVRAELTEQAGSDLILLLDDDDRLLPDAVAQIQALAARRPEAGLITGYAVYIDQAGHGIETINPKRPRIRFQGRMVEKASCIHPFCFSKRVYEKTQGWWSRALHHGLGEDADLFLKLVEHTDIYVIPEAIFEYRVHPSGMTKVVDEDHVIEGVRTSAEQAVRRRGFDWEVRRDNVFSIYRKLTEWRAPGEPIRTILYDRTETDSTSPGGTGSNSPRPNGHSGDSGPLNWIARLFRRT